MVVSNIIEQVIESNQSRLENLDLTQFLTDLQSNNILNKDEVEGLIEITSTKKRNKIFIKILMAGDDKAFYEFCGLLTQNQADSVKNLGSDLRLKANNGKEPYQ